MAALVPRANKHILKAHTLMGGLAARIPRNEVESIHELSGFPFFTSLFLRPLPFSLRRKYATHRFVKIQVNKIQRGSFSLLCGGYVRDLPTLRFSRVPVS